MSLSAERPRRLCRPSRDLTWSRFKPSIADRRISRRRVTQHVAAREETNMRKQSLFAIAAGLVLALGVAGRGSR